MAGRAAPLGGRGEVGDRERRWRPSRLPGETETLVQGPLAAVGPAPDTPVRGLSDPRTHARGGRERDRCPVTSVTFAGET